VSAKDKNSEVFSYFKKVKGDFRARSHTICYNKGILTTSLHLCLCKCVHVTKNTRER